MDIRWNTNFVRGLAQSVLDRAKVIRNGLVASMTAERSKAAPEKEKMKAKPKMKAKVQPAVSADKKARKPSASAGRRKPAKKRGGLDV